MTRYRFKQRRLSRSGRTDDESVSAAWNLKGDVAQIEVAHPHVQAFEPDHRRSAG
jgi:hypothetical protein